MSRPERIFYAGIFEHDKRPLVHPDPRHRLPLPSDRLTVREVEVMNLLAMGQTKHEAADQLRISVRTLETHKERAMQKIGSRRVIRALVMGGFLVPTGGPQL